MKRLALLVVLAFGMTGTAEAAQPWDRWIARAKVPTAAVILHVEPCPNGWNACYGAGHIWLSVYPGELRDPDARQFWRQQLYHELGHAYDLQVLTDIDRSRLLPLLRRSAWPEELFASAYAGCARSLRTPYDWSGYNWYPSDRRHRRFCRALVALR